MIELGTKVRDRVSGVQGIAVARTEWLNGCTRVTVQPQELKDGQPVETTTVDEPQLEVVGRKHPLREGRLLGTGGPKDDRSALRR